MTTHVLELGRRKFVVGLFWQSLSRPRELRKEAAELSDKINFDLVVLRRGAEMAQAGYAHSDEGAQTGMVSLAAAVAHGVASAPMGSEARAPRSWLGVFALPSSDRWAYFAVRDDGFLPNGDFCGTRDEVLERLHGDYAVGGWNIVIGDEALASQGFHEFEAKRLDELVTVKRGRARVERGWALKPVRRTMPLLRIGLVAGIVALALVGAFTYVLHQQGVERERALDLARQQLAAKRGASPALPHPWPNEPHPAEFVRACTEHLELPFAGGWHLEEYVCDPQQTLHRWTRGESTVGNLLQAVPDALVELSGDLASYRTDLHLGPSTDEALRPSKEVIVPLMDGFQRAGLILAVTPAPPPLAAAPNASGVAAAQGGAVVQPDWQTFRFNIKAQGVPAAAVAQLLDVPGVRPHKLSYRNGEWTLEGVIYAK